jgi:hypothetical protein
MRSRGLASTPSLQDFMEEGVLIPDTKPLGRSGHFDVRRD